MTINEHQRYQLHQILETTLGPENAATLMAHLPPVGWADVATKHDLNVLRSDLHALEERLELRISAHVAGLRTELAGGRTEIAGVRAEIAGVRAEFHEGMKKMTLTFIGATTAIVSIIAGLTNLF